MTLFQNVEINLIGHELGESLAEIQLHNDSDYPISKHVLNHMEIKKLTLQLWVPALNFATYGLRVMTCY